MQRAISVTLSIKKTSSVGSWELVSSLLNNQNLFDVTETEMFKDEAMFQVYSYFSVSLVRRPPSSLSDSLWSNETRRYLE